MASILILHRGVYGHTRRISERVQGELAALGHRADVMPLEGGTVDAGAYDAIVIGASIRNGKHNPAVLAYIRRHLALLETKPSAFFSVNLVARKPVKNTPGTNPYVKAFLARSPWKPRLVGVFAGDLEYQRYGFFDRHVIRFIMTLTGGPTDPATNVVFTDWDKVRDFAVQVAALAAGRPD